MLVAGTGAVPGCVEKARVTRSFLAALHYSALGLHGLRNWEEKEDAAGRVPRVG